MENSFHSRGSKNFVLKSDYLNNNSKHGSKKNLSSFVDPGLYNQNQKSLFKTGGSFLDQEDDDFKKEIRPREKHLYVLLTINNITINTLANNHSPQKQNNNAKMRRNSKIQGVRSENIDAQTSFKETSSIFLV